MILRPAVQKNTRSKTASAAPPTSPAGRAGWALETMDERYGKAGSQKIQDRRWIEEAALAGMSYSARISRSRTTRSKHRSFT